MRFNNKSRIYVAGHKGMVGSAVIRLLKKKGYCKIFYKTRKQLDLQNQKKVYSYIMKIKPQYVIICAGKVGGIKANSLYKANFIYENLMIQNNLINSSYKAGVKNLIFLGSSCIYPKFARQPIAENELLNGKLEKTNDAYAIAKIAGIKLCESYNFQYNLNYKCLMPCNIFGPNDNYDTDTSHFFPAIIKKIHSAKIKKNKQIFFWGTGKSKRELIYVDDVAEACIFFLRKKIKDTIINIGSGIDFTIKDYIKFISKKLDVNAKIKFNKIKELDGTPRKILNSSLARKSGWKPKHDFDSAFATTYNCFKKNTKPK
jgi:GDP-L-fucose synthase